MILYSASSSNEVVLFCSSSQSVQETTDKCLYLEGHNMTVVKADLCLGVVDGIVSEDVAYSI